MTRQKHLLQGKESAEHLAAKYLYMFDSQEKEASVNNYLESIAETNDSKHNRMKALMLRGIRHEYEIHRRSESGSYRKQTRSFNCNCLQAYQKGN